VIRDERVLGEACTPRNLIAICGEQLFGDIFELWADLWGFDWALVHL